MVAISIDFSGAGTHRSNQRGIAVAKGEFGAAPSLDHGFSRTQIGRMLCRLAEGAHRDRTRHLVGLDFAFSFPFAEKGSVFPDGSKTRSALWEGIRDEIWDRGVAQDYADAHQEHFLWYESARKHTHTGRDYVYALRSTERAAHELGAPANTAFRLVGANQVGKGSICGMALLQALLDHCQKHKRPLLIWPFFYLNSAGELVPVGAALDLEKLAPCLVVVETYPRLQKHQAGVDGTKWNHGSVVPHLAEHFWGELPATMPATGDELDALASWYALAGRATVTGEPLGAARLATPTRRLAEAPSELLEQEGWIFGV